jgi:hypothetical protein
MGEGAVKGEILPVVDDPRRGQARLSFESLDRADLATPLPDPGERFHRPATTLRLLLILEHTTRDVLVTEWAKPSPYGAGRRLPSVYGRRIRGDEVPRSVDSL